MIYITDKKNLNAKYMMIFTEKNPGNENSMGITQKKFCHGAKISFFVYL